MEGLGLCPFIFTLIILHKFGLCCVIQDEMEIEKRIRCMFSLYIQIHIMYIFT